MCVCKKDMFYCHFLKIIRNSQWSLSESSVPLFSSVVVSETSLLSTKFGTDCTIHIIHEIGWGTPGYRGTGVLGEQGTREPGSKAKNFLYCTFGYLRTTIYISVLQLVEIAKSWFQFHPILPFTRNPVWH